MHRTIIQLSRESVGYASMAARCALEELPSAPELERLPSEPDLLAAIEDVDRVAEYVEKLIAGINARALRQLGLVRSAQEPNPTANN